MPVYRVAEVLGNRDHTTLSTCPAVCSGQEARVVQSRLPYTLAASYIYLSIYLSIYLYASFWRIECVVS